jgi:O-acetyl-ADP-ribose deacetylase (regulator of RNase III)
MLGLRRYKRTQIDIWQGDITQFSVDLMVNAANFELAGGLGVDGAIHAAGGPEILAECKKIGNCPTGSCVVTTAGRLPAKNVIHAVGPVWVDGNNKEAELLKTCYENIFVTAKNLGGRHLSIPAISTGAYRFPQGLAAEIAMTTAKKFIDHEYQSAPQRITFVAIDGAAYDVLQKHLFASFADEIDHFEQ